MKSTMKRLALCGLLVAVAAIGCRKDAQQKQATSNSNFELELLFERDGMKVYRFYDGNAVYICDVRGTVQWDETRSNGKTTYKVRRQSITVANGN
jgi:hypothetical protein